MTEGALFKINVPSWLRSEAAAQPFPRVSEAREVSCFTKDARGKVTPGDRSQLHAFREPPLNVNLGTGFNTFVNKVHHAPVERVVSAVTAVDKAIIPSVDVVTFRNNINKIAGTVFDSRNSWEMDCCTKGSTLFLDIRMMRPDAVGDHHMRQMYYGYRFEALCTNTADEPVDPNTEFGSIAVVEVGHHRILMSSEIDCCEQTTEARREQEASSATEFATRNYIELKTIRAIRDDRGLSTLYRFKFPKFWTQSFFAGVPTIILGIRDDDGTLLSTKRMQVQDLYGEAHNFLSGQRRQNCWQPAIIANFVVAVLDAVRETCARREGSTVRVAYDGVSREVSARNVVSPAEEGAGLAQRLQRLGGLSD